MTRDSNFFKGFQAGTTLGNEDFLSASLIAIMRRIPEVQHAFLNWVSNEVPAFKPEWVELEWEISGQESFKTERFGRAMPDMVFKSDDLELWFEHKLGSKQGVRIANDDSGDEIGQLEKYVGAARLHSRDDANKPRVMIFYITAAHEALNPDEGLLYTDQLSAGLVMGKNGGLRWKHLHRELSRLEVQTDDKLARLLYTEFLDWWANDARLMDLPVTPELQAKNRAGLANLITDWANLNLTHLAGPAVANGSDACTIARFEGLPTFHLRIEPKEVEKMIGMDGKWRGGHVLWANFRSFQTEPVRLPFTERTTDEGFQTDRIEFELAGLHAAVRVTLGKLTRQGNLPVVNYELMVSLADWDKQTDENRPAYMIELVEALVDKYAEFSGVHLRKA